MKKQFNIFSRILPSKIKNRGNHGYTKKSFYIFYLLSKNLNAKWNDNFARTEAILFATKDGYFILLILLILLIYFED